MTREKRVTGNYQRVQTIAGATPFRSSAPSSPGTAFQHSLYSPLIVGRRAFAPIAMITRRSKPSLLLNCVTCIKHKTRLDTPGASNIPREMVRQQTRPVQSPQYHFPGVYNCSAASFISVCGPAVLVSLYW